MKKIGLFGGTFDPPHTGHTALAKATLLNFSLDKIIFIPAGNPPHKTQKRVSDKTHRFEMVKMAIKGEPNFSISDFDIKNEKPNYSYLTIEHFKNEYPDDEIFFIVGADSYRDFPKWKNFPDILSLCTFIVLNRNDADLGEYFKKYCEIYPEHKALFSDDFSYDVSSTELREKIKSGENCKNLLPDGVYEYIKKHKLYHKESL